MITISIKEICQAAGAALPKALRGVKASGVAIDSRSIRPGDLYFALRGRSQDGHRFVEDALSQGACAAVVSLGWKPERNDLRVLRVEDPEEALVDLAGHYRRKLTPRVIGVTGSNGKTTTKEMLSAILSRTSRTVKAAASFNNRIGVPLTIFNMDQKTETAVIEMGTSGPGEIEELCRVANPEIGVITTVTEAHLDGLGDLDGVIRAKSEMAHHLGRRGGILVINGDDEGCRRLRAQVEQSSLLDPVGGIVTYGLGKECDIRAVECKEGRKGISFYVRGIGWFRVERGGMPGVWCALAAIAVSSLLGAEAADMREGILRYTPPPMRMEPETVAGVTLVNDAYNANPQSAMAALDSIARIPCRGRRSMVLGDMRELGKRSRSLHTEFGREVFSSRVECLWTLGKEARWAAEGARRAGMNQKHVFSFESPDCLAEALGIFLRPGDAVLFKASRAMKLEGVAKEVAEILRGDNEIHRVSRPEGSRQAG